MEEKISDYVSNLVFVGLTIEQIDKIPKWLLENMEKNKPELKRQINNLLIEARIDEQNKISHTLHCILSEDVDAELDHSDIEKAFEDRLAQLKAQKGDS